MRIVSAVFGKEDFTQEVKNVSATSNDDVASHLDFIKEIASAIVIIAEVPCTNPYNYYWT